MISVPRVVQRLMHARCNPLLVATVVMLGLLACNPAQTNRMVADASESVGADRRALYDEGLAYPEFLDGVNRREEMWRRNSAQGEVPQGLLSKLANARGDSPEQLHILAVAEYGCSDSANIVPYLARFADEVQNIDLRIINSKVGREVMESHLTPDGRTATPTIVVLDSEYREMGCLIERPKELQDWALANKESLSSDEFLKQKFAWYDNDLGKQSTEEIASVIMNAGNELVNCGTSIDE